MMKLVVGGIVIVGVAVVGFVLAGAKQESSPRSADAVAVFPIAWLAPVATGVATVISLIASYFPARRAAQLDPTTVLQEI